MGATLGESMRLQLPTDRLILEVLVDGRNVSANISREIDRNRHYVSRRLGHLLDYGLITKIGPAEESGLYELTEKGEVALELIDRYDEVEDFEALVEQELAERADN